MFCFVLHYLSYHLQFSLFIHCILLYCSYLLNHIYSFRKGSLIKLFMFFDPILEPQITKMVIGENVVVNLLLLYFVIFYLYLWFWNIIKFKFKISGYPTVQAHNCCQTGPRPVIDKWADCLWALICLKWSLPKDFYYFDFTTILF